MLELGATALAVAALAALAQAVSGFGFALVAVPLMAIVAGPKEAVIAVTLLSAGMTIFAVTREHRGVDWGSALPLSIAGVVGLPVGLVALVFFSSRSLSLLISAMVVLFVVLLLSGWTMGADRRNLMVAGGVSGALLTATGMNGPPVVIAFEAIRLPPLRFRATLQAVFCVQDVFAMVGFLLVGQVTARTMVVAAAGAPGLIAGWLAGDRIFARVDSRAFRRLVIGMLLLSAAATTWSALRG